MKSKKLAILLGAVVIAAVLAVIFWPSGSKDNKTLVGHSGGTLIAVAYAAEQDSDWCQDYELVRLGTAADVGYALLSGDIDAGFVEVSKIPALEKLEGFEKLTAVGEITFPYGSTVILRKGLDLRLADLNGYRIGVSSTHCKLLEAFEGDAERLNIDLSDAEFVTIPFDDMLPALEAGSVDAIVSKSAYAALAQDQGHMVLYQNWDVIPGDECCPAIVDQVQYVLLARKDAPQAALLLPQSLIDIQKAVEINALREAVTKATSISLSVLDSLPVATFGLADHSLIETIVGHSHPEGEAHDHDEDDRDEEEDG